MNYWLQDYNFYAGQIKLFTLKRSDYIIYSILKIEDENGVSLIRCKMPYFLGLKSLKVLEQKFNDKVSFIKKGKLFYLQVILNNNSFEITFLPSSGLFQKLKGDFIINNEKVGVLCSKMEWLNTKRCFEFTEENEELIHYCLIYFALRYYDIDDAL